MTAIEKQNFATRTAALTVPSVGNNYLRHETLQRFMLANNSVTIAVEVPIWLTPADIAALDPTSALASRILIPHQRVSGRAGNRGKIPGEWCFQAGWPRRRMRLGRCGTAGAPEMLSLAPR